MATTAVSPASAVNLASESSNQSKEQQQQQQQHGEQPLVRRPTLELPDNIRCSDLPEVIHEEEGEEESATEPSEPVTPTSVSHHHPFHTHYQPRIDPPSRDPVVSVPSSHVEVLKRPIIVNTEPTPPSTPTPQNSNFNSNSNSTTVTAAAEAPASPPAGRPTTSASHRPSPLRKASMSIKGMFRRPSSSSEVTAVPPTPPATRPSLEQPRKLSLTMFQSSAGRKGSVSSTNQHSPTSSHPNSPPSPSSPSSTLHGGQNGNNPALLSVSPPTEGPFAPRRPNRSSTGLSLRERSRVMFGSTPRPHREEDPRIRSPSLGDVQNQPARPGFSIPAVSGAGLKARRMSTSLPDDFSVDTCPLGDEYTNSSKMPGKRGKEVGRGATATVKVMCRRGGDRSDLFAVKEFRKCGSKEDKTEYEQKVKSEFSIAQSLHHPNIVRSFRLCTHNGRYNHVMEYCSFGELFSLVQRNYLQPKDTQCFFKQVVRGVAHLHENGIAHRDIKLENLLLSDDGYVKITDFGVSEVFSGLHPGLRSSGGECGREMGEVRLSSPGICGSLPYIAPEVLAKLGSYDPRPLDVWSCAVVYLTLMFRGNLWPAANVEHTNYARFISGWDKFLAESPTGIPTEDKMPSCGPAFKQIGNRHLKLLLLKMLHPDPSKRATIVEVINDRFMKSIECCSPEASRKGEEAQDRAVIDAAGKGSTKRAGKMVVQKIHHHFPPEKKYLPQYRFDMGDGY